MEAPTQPDTRIHLALIGVGSFFLVTVLTALITLSINDWFGFGDIYGLPIQSLPLAFVHFIAILVFLSSTNKWKWGNRLIVGSLIGISLGYFSTICLQLVLGGWFYAISFSIGICWILGSLSAFLVVIFLEEPKSIIFGTGTFFLTAGVLTFLYIQANRPPPSTIVYFKPGVTQERVNDFRGEYICIPTGQGGGCALLDELNSVAAYSEPPLRGLYLTFWKSVSAEEIEIIKERILEAPIVYKIVDVESN